MFLSHKEEPELQEIEIKDEAAAELKRRLFAEKVKLSEERSELDRVRERLEEEEKKLSEEKRQLSRETMIMSSRIKALQESAEYERKRLKEDKRMLDRRRKIIEHVYQMLESDKEQIRLKYADIDRQKELLRQMREEAVHQSSGSRDAYKEGVFFRGVNSAVALRKRYKDLCRIYHPDNMCGDKEIIIKIKEEYESLCDIFGLSSKRA